MRKRWKLLVALLTAIAILAAAQPPRVVVVRLDGAVDEGMVYLIRRAAAEAERGVLVVELDSYGGYLQSADRAVAEIVACNCRVVAWVPPGGKATSAATIIALAAEKLYIAPGAVLGAVKPTPSDEKTMEYVYSRLLSLLERKGVPNSTSIARSMVYDAKAISYEEALRLRVADGSAGSIEELLRAEGLSGTVAERLPSDTLREVYSLIFNPLLAILFLLLGVLLISLEFHVTGFQGWGVAGAALVLLALYTFNLVGLGLVTLFLALLGSALILLELLQPGIQIFGLAGAAMLLLATLLEYFSNPPALSGAAVPVLAGLAILAGLAAVIVAKGAEVVRTPAPSRESVLIGKIGIARTPVSQAGGVVLVESELWSAVSEEEIPAGSRVIVVGVDGLTLRVRKAE
ncbi:MAG: NfeD family protein [Thermofilum sp.]